MTDTLPISQLPNAQAISAVSAAAVITLDRCVIGSGTPLAGSFTTVSASTPIASSSGGTGNGFTKFSGPGTSEKTFTLPNATSTILTDNAAVTVSQGGTSLQTLTANNVILGNGTSAPTFVAPGTSGNVLTSNGTTWTSSAAAGGSGDMILLNTQSASTSASIDFTSLISSTYKNYLVLFDNVITGSTCTLRLRTSTNNGSSYDAGASDYNYAGEYIDSGGVAVTGFGAAGATFIGLTGSSMTTGGLYNGSICLPNPLYVGICCIRYDISHVTTGGQIFDVRGSGCRNTAADVDAFQILPSTGTLTSGTFKLYGIL